MPSVSDPDYVEDLIGNRTVSSLWYRVTGTTTEVKGFLRCDGEPVSVAWRPLVADGSGNLVSADLDPRICSPLRDRVVRRLPTPELRVGPADEDPDGWTCVQNRTFFWVDQGAASGKTVSATASAGGISVTVQAAPGAPGHRPG